MSTSKFSRLSTRAAAASAATLVGIGSVVGIATLNSDSAENSAAEGLVNSETSTSDTASTSDNSSASTSTDSLGTSSQLSTNSSGSSSSATSSDSSESTTSTDSSNTASSSAASDGTWEGSVENTPYGPMQVSVTISAGAITDIQWLQLPSDNRSERINSYAAPQLVEEALTAQSADVNSVSGASYTSESFKNSLQAALTEANF